ncbi:MAG: RNA polymerase sigma factor [Proteobacteria bacterium]|nr:RNA polymerase sigma factor [Pseudomonadota bacterium]
MNIWFRLQVNKNQHGLYAVCYQMLKNSLEAEEVVQDSFMKLWQAQENGKKQTKAWLYKVAKNQCLDLIRRRSHEMKYQQHNILNQQVCKSAYDELINTELSEHISAAIEELKEPYKSLIVLREISQLSYQQLADVLDLNVPQIKVYLHRARHSLKEKLMDL